MKQIEEALKQLKDITGKTYLDFDDTCSWDELAKMIRGECLIAARKVEQLEALHEHVLSGSTPKSQVDILQEAAKNQGLNCTLIDNEQAPDFSGIPLR